MKKIKHSIISLSLLAGFLCVYLSVQSQRHMEFLGRGVIALRTDSFHVFISWRLLATDPGKTVFNIYRKTGGQAFHKLNTTALTGQTHFTDSITQFIESVTYEVRPVIDNKEQVIGAGDYTLAAGTSIRQYLSIPIQPPPAGEIMGQSYTYSANDASVGDLDGDGEYEIILKWDPTNAKNPPQPGFTGSQILDAYKMDGRLLWRIDLGKNIRAGAAYTQFLVYDFDGDGKAEMICKTADGAIDGKGKPIGDAAKDWRTYTKDDPKYGKIVDGPEYITVFDGLTGAALATQLFIPDRYPLDGWGGIGGNGGNDNNGGRADRYTAGVAYLDGKLPSAVYVRGWYGRSAIAAWDWRNGKLTCRWLFDSKDSKNPYSGMGNHSLSVADVDNDGKDEICIGSMTVDDNGKGLYTTGLRHGDALHLTDMDPDRPGLEVFGIHESEEKTLALQTPGVAMFDACTGKILFSLASGVDVGRGVAADIDPTHPGFENWGGPGGLRDVHGKTISEKTPSSTNFVIWWDGDLTRELLDKNHIDKWLWQEQTTVNLLTADGCTANNGTKATPCLSADLFGDWREEVIWRTNDNKELRIYATTIPTTYRFVTLMQDPQYRLSIAWQNVSYNQPPHPGFYLGAGMKDPPKPSVTITRPAIASPDAAIDSLLKIHAKVNKQTLIDSDTFERPDSSKWIIEMDPQANSSVNIKGGKLVTDTKGGVTVWRIQKFSGNILIEYDRKIVMENGVNDRLSDLNQFWMAEDPFNKNLFTRKGVLESYDSLRLYYVGMGGNSNTTTRFRKYEGSGERRLIQEFTDTAHLLQANHVYHITTIVKDGVTSFWVDGNCYFIYKDPQTLQQGYFGFRSTKSRQEIDNFKVYTIR